MERANLISEQTLLSVGFITVCCQHSKMPGANQRGVIPVMSYALSET
jgi:hypothetical protein